MRTMTRAEWLATLDAEEWKRVRIRSLVVIPVCLFLFFVMIRIVAFALTDVVHHWHWLAQIMVCGVMMPPIVFSAQPVTQAFRITWWAWTTPQPQPPPPEPVVEVRYVRPVKNTARDGQQELGRAWLAAPKQGCSREQSE